MTAAEAPRRKYWGWGFENEGLSQEKVEAYRKRTAQRYGVDDLPTAEAPKLSEIELRAPRVSAPGALAERSSTDPWDRLVHSYGKSYPDSVRAFMRQFPNPPDIVAYPQSEEDVAAWLDWATDHNVAVIPFGGGTSVVGGVEPDVGDSFAGVVSLDLTDLNQVLEVDKTSRAARIQAGASGPEFEAQLKPHGLTLRHFPQSFALATLGGMIATRSGGHFATVYTHIDDFVESTRSVTPRGILESRRLPGSGAGPSPDRLMLGSEGILGVITEAWMRVQDRPTFRAAHSVQFESFAKAAEAVRALSQSALFPANCRLIDAQEAASSGAGDGESALLVLAFESADHPVDAWMERATEIVLDHGGLLASQTTASGENSHRSGAAGNWRNAFIRAPFYREHSTPMGLIADTFETAITWDRFTEFHARVKERTLKVIEEVTGKKAFVTCRFTHVYPDGPAPYFTFQGLGRGLEGALDQWCEIKAATNEIVVSEGGTVTHHHAVGRDHRPSGYDKQRPELFAQALAAAKQSLDPKSVLNPGVLIDAPGRPAGCGGAVSPMTGNAGEPRH